MTGAPLLEVRDLAVTFTSDLGPVTAVNGVDLDLAQGETLVILGESGSGKSVTAQAIMGVVPDPPGRVRAERIALEGTDLQSLSPGARARIRGKQMSLIFQDALTSLNPRFKIGTQIAEVIRFHLGVPKVDAWDRAEELLHHVGIPSPRERLQAYPHQLSGGMRQRALIAMSIALSPKLLIADEPTTALDVTVQAQVLGLIKRLQSEAGMGLILITHDLSVAKRVADRVAVMYAGQIVETASTEDLFGAPQHPYTRALMRSTPSVAALGQDLQPIPGSPPDLRRLPPGCPFQPRCAVAGEVCAARPAPRRDHGCGHLSLCHLEEAAP